MIPCTAGTLLGGRVRYCQPATGYRTGIEPVLLAAAVPARPGQRVLEGGTGAGAALLCLATRVPGVRGAGVERDPALAALAGRNAAANGFGGLDMVAADLLAWPGHAPSDQAASDHAPSDQARSDHAPFDHSPFDHAMANPPWHPAGGTAAADPMRDAAKRGRPGLLAAWAAALGARLRHRGTLTLIVPARASVEALAAMQAAGCGTLALLPLWPAAGREARIVLVQGVRGGRGGARVLPGLALHDGPRFTAAAEAVLRGGGPLAT